MDSFSFEPKLFFKENRYVLISSACLGGFCDAVMKSKGIDNLGLEFLLNYGPSIMGATVAST